MKEKNTIKIKSYESPCGVLLLGSFGGKLCLCDWQVEKHCDRVNQRLKRVLCAEFEISTSEIIEESIEQLNEYFAGQRKEFSVPLLFVGTDFQKTVNFSLLQKNCLKKKCPEILLPFTTRWPIRKPLGFPVKRLHLEQWIQIQTVPASFARIISIS